MAMTLRQRRFVREYLAGPPGVRGIAVQAARRAGFKTDTSEAVGYQLMRRPEIQKKIRMHLTRLDVTTDDVLQELRRIGFSDMRQFVEWDGDDVTLKPSDEMTDDDAAAVAEVSKTESKDGGSIKFKLHDKVAALQHLGRILGAFKDAEVGERKVINVAVILEQPAALTNGHALPGLKIALEENGHA
jgi:phage terminase small subunit